MTVYQEFNAGASLNCGPSFVNGGVNGGVNYGQGVTQNVPAAEIAYGSVGTLYYHLIKNRTSFDYKHYTKGGRHILGFNTNGSETAHSGYVDRSTGSVSLIVWVQPAGSSWPDTTEIDLLGIGQ